MGRVICYGVVGVDYLLSVRSFPEADGHARILAEEVVVGGEAANTAVRLDQLGCSVVLYGNSVGADRDGALFTDELSRTGVDCRIEKQGSTTGHAYVVRDGEGTRTILGAFGELVGPQIPADMWEGVDHLAIDPFVEGALDVARAAQNTGIEVTAIELGPGNAMAPYVTTVINSAGFMRRHELGEHSDCAAALRGAGVQTVIVTRGAQGSEIYEASGVSHQPAYAVETTDTTGAGDAFRAGWIFARQSGWAVGEAIRVAAATSALSCCYIGGCGGSVASGEALRMAGIA